MLDTVLGFSGRLNRLRYFLLSMAIGAVTLIAAVVAVVAGAPHHALGTRPDIGPALLMLAPIGLAYLWAALSIQACRLRDMGWKPAYVLPAALVAMVVLQALTRVAPPVGLLSGLFNLAFGGVLLFWPSAPHDTAAPGTIAPRAAPGRSTGPKAPARRPPVIAPQASAAPSMPRTSFGQRGL